MFLCVSFVYSLVYVPFSLCFSSCSLVNRVLSLSFQLVSELGEFLGYLVSERMDFGEKEHEWGNKVPYSFA